MLEVKGKFNVELFYKTLARILSEREHADITVTVTMNDDLEKVEQGQLIKTDI